MSSDRLARLLLTQEIAGFLYAEAELLDERRHDEWLALLAEDIRYWMPMRRNVKYGDTTREFTRESEDISWFDEGKETLTRRVRQIQTGIHWAEEPQSRITHMVSNVQLLEVAPDAGMPREVKAKSRFLIYRNRVETETDLLVGKREDTLRREGDRLADRPAEDHPRPERADDEEPDIFLLGGGMMMNGTRGFYPGLIDLASGQISREIFVNDDIYAQEQERVFARSWLFIGHESQIPNPGDFFASRMGEESVILCRDRAGAVHVFLNSCRHRGMKVCRYDEGNTTVFTCPYHGWSYGTNGALVGVPYFREAYHSALDKAKRGLVKVAQLCCYKGTVWANWDASAPPFLEYLGEFRRFLDLILDGWDGREGQAELLGGVQKWIIPCNWKFPAENFSGDTYHNISHRSVDLVGVGPSGRSRRDYNELNASRKLHVAIPDRGHQTITYVLPKDHEPQAAYQNSPEVAQYFRDCEEERRRRPGANSRLIGAPGEIFPNVALLPRQPRTLAVWHPKSAHETEVWRFFFVDRDAPQQVKNFLRDYYIRYSGPAGMTEQDDMENWNYAHAASRGTIARRYPYTYEMGLGHAVEDYEWDGLKVPGRVIDLTKAQASEEPMRNLYRRWAQFMEADSWDELMTWRRDAPPDAQAAQ